MADAGVCLKIILKGRVCSKAFTKFKLAISVSKVFFKLRELAFVRKRLGSCV